MREESGRSWHARALAAVLTISGVLGVGGGARADEGPPVSAAQAAATPEATSESRTPIIVDVTVRGIVHDPTRDLLYVSVDGTSARYPNRVITVDPATGEVLAATNVGTQPGVLAVSDDGRHLYVGVDGNGSVRQYRLPAMTPGWTHSLGMGFSAVLTAEDIEVSPVDPDLVAVTATEGDYFRRALLLDGGVPRATVVEGSPAVNVVEFSSDGTELWGANNQDSGYDFTRIAVGPGGLTRIDSVRGLVGFAYADIAVAADLVYATYGRVIDPSGATPTLVDTLTPPRWSRGVATDPERDRVYFASDVDSGVTVTAYDTTTRDQVGRWVITGALQSGRRLTSLGNGRVVFSADGHPLGAGEQLVIVGLDVDYRSFGEYTPLTPRRILDTRSGLGRGGRVGPIGTDRTIDVAVAGAGGVPSTGVTAVVMNVTAVFPSRAGYLTVFPTGLARPTISNLNFAPGTAVANLVTMPLGTGGKVSVYNPFGATDVLFDVAGYYADVDGPDGLRFHAIDPGRIMDTRSGLGGRDGAIGARKSATLQVSGTRGVPRRATAVALNVTVTGTTAGSFLSVWPGDVGRPVVSNLNFGPGATIANQVIVRLPSNGTIKLYNEAGAAHVIVDVVGYYDDVEDGDSGRFLPIPPTRKIDTRIDSPFPAPGALGPANLLYTGDADETLAAYVVNVTVTSTSGLGYVSVFPYQIGATPPNASTLNYGPGQTVPNHAIARTGPYLGFYNAGGTAHLIVELFGAFA